MLSRTADHLFWMGRYMERAENTARMLDVSRQTAMLPQSSVQVVQGWAGVLSICELQEAYARRHGAIEPAKVLHFMVADNDNPSSIIACLQAARENARAVRGTLTTEVWETYNAIWLEARRMLRDGSWQRDAGRFFEWVKGQSNLARGMVLGTMQMDQSRHFMRLGTFIERGDNTARLLDVRFHAPSSADDDLAEFYHWSAVLRSLSAYEAYRRVYRDVVDAQRVVQLLMLRADMPRSLLACTNDVVVMLDHLTTNKNSPTRRKAGRLQAQLQYAEIEEVMEKGLHHYLTDYLHQVGDLGVSVGQEFLGAA